MKRVYLGRKGIEQIAERLGWEVEWDEQTRQENQHTMKFVSFYQYSPAGEDFGFDIEFETCGDLIDQVQSYSFNFDIDEHIEMWIEARRNGTSGVPDTRTLVKDAEDIDEMIAKLAAALIDAKNKLDNKYYERRKECLSM